MQEALMPVIHVGPLRGKGTYMKTVGEKKEKRGKGRYAHYWHWVAYGTKNRTMRKDKTPRVRMPNGRWVTLVSKERGTQPANNYADKAYTVVQPTLDQMADKIMKRMMKTYDTILKKKGLTKKL